jgi:Domain of unknown function (DUF4352)
MSGTSVWRRYWRAGAAALTACAGFGLLTAGPAGLAIGVRDYQQRQAEAAFAAEHQLGTEVRDGPVAFVVHNVSCGPAKSETMNGQLCEVTIGARNDGAEEITVPGGAQMLHGTGGARLRPFGGDGKPFGTLEPGQAATATIAFDIPAASVVNHVEVHATSYSRGQAVAIDGRPLPLLTAGDRATRD